MQKNILHIELIGRPIKIVAREIKTLTEDILATGKKVSSESIL
jgi:hypothetical protein